LVWAFITAGVIAFLFAHGLKHLVSLQRPSKILEAGSFFLTGPAHKSFSFPSGHTTSICMVAAIFILSIRFNWIKMLVFIIAVIVSFSRVIVGVHWPIDIFGGVIVGWFSGWSGLALIRRYRWGIRTTGRHVFSILLILCALAMLFVNHTGYPQAEIFQRILGGVMLLYGLYEYKKFIISIT
jgi:membrane-associated phospholipid phosphatase